MASQASLSARAKYGVYPAKVVSVQDPDAAARVQVRFLELEGEDPTPVWARLATMMAGDERGTFFIPELGDEVLVVFVGGDTSRPCVIGSVWNGDHEPPESTQPDNPLRSITSPGGSKLIFDDSKGKNGITLSLNSDRGHVIIQDKPNGIQIRDGAHNVIELTADGIKITSSSPIEINGSDITLTGSTIKLSSALVMVSGILKALSVHTGSVVAESYTNGAGNIW